ncbi:MAG: ABC transporter permease [Candidatus Bipolaricaulota bacterium]
MKKRPVIFAFVVLDIILFVLPTVLVVIIAFTSAKTITFPPRGFSFRWFFEVYNSSLFRRGIRNSLVAATIDATLAAPIGVLAALALHKYTVKFKNFFQLYLLLPFTVPLVISGVGLMIIFSKFGLIGKVWGVGLAVLAVDIPFMIFAVSSSINSLNDDLEHAAQNLGASEIRAFFTVIIPAIKPGIITGYILMWLLGFNEFLVSLMVTNRSSVTLPVAMYTSMRSDITPDIAAAASLVILVAVILILIVDRLVGMEKFLSV